jgi:hypothetical protein
MIFYIATQYITTNLLGRFSIRRAFGSLHSTNPCHPKYWADHLGLPFVAGCLLYRRIDPLIFNLIAVPLYESNEIKKTKPEEVFYGDETNCEE